MRKFRNSVKSSVSVCFFESGLLVILTVCAVKLLPLVDLSQWHIPTFVGWFIEYLHVSIEVLKQLVQTDRPTELQQHIKWRQKRTNSATFTYLVCAKCAVSSVVMQICSVAIKYISDTAKNVVSRPSRTTCIVVRVRNTHVPVNTIKLQAQMGMGWDSDSVDTFRIGGRVGVHVKSVGNKFMALHSLLNVGWLV